MQLSIQVLGIAAGRVGPLTLRLKGGDHYFQEGVHLLRWMGVRSVEINLLC